MSLQDFFIYPDESSNSISATSNENVIINFNVNSSQLLLEDRRFYVYVYLDPRKPGKYVYGDLEFDHEPFYIGKGKDERYLDHLKEADKWVGKKVNFKECNSIKIGKILKIYNFNKTPILIFLKENLTDKQAQELERLYISKIGRIDLKTGPLSNLTDGGEGVSGYKYTIEQRQQRSKSHIGKKHSPETKQKMSISNKGRTYTEEQKKSMSESQKKLYENGYINPNTGLKRTEEQKKNMSDAQKRIVNKENYINPMKGKNHSEKSKNIMSEKMSGENHPNWGKPRSSETCSKIGKSNKGKERTIDWRNNISKAKKGKCSGKNNPMYGKESAMKGKTHTEESKEKMSETKNKYWSEHKNTMFIYNKELDILKRIDENETIPDGFVKGGRPLSEEQKRINKEKNCNKDYSSISGENNSFYGKTHSEETRRKMSESQKSKIRIYNPETNIQKNWPKDQPIPEGFVRGCRPKSFEALKNMSDAQKNHIKIYNPELDICKYISKDQPIPEGWRRGQRPKTEEQVRKYVEATKGTIKIYNKETDTEKCHRKDQPIPEGFVKGTRKNHKKY